MFEIFNIARKKRLSFEQLQTMQMDRSGNAYACAQQVVLSLEGSDCVTPSALRIPGAAKKALALKLMGELLEQLGIVAPDSLIDTAVEAADCVTPSAFGLHRGGNAVACKAIDAQAPRPQPVPPFKLDISGRPASGGTERGLSL